MNVEPLESKGILKKYAPEKENATHLLCIKN